MKYFTLFIFVFQLSFAQEKLSGRNYFDANWKLSSSSYYSYYREAYKYSSGYYLINDYYKGGTKQSMVYVDTYDFACGKHPIDCGAKNGYVFFYYSNGKQQKKQRFKNGLIISLEEWSYYGNLITQKGCIYGDCYAGYGIYVFDNGDRYTGDFKYGKRHGYGTYLWKSGEKYEGEFSYDKIVKTNNGTSITAEDVKTGLEIMNEAVKLYRLLTDER